MRSFIKTSWDLTKNFIDCTFRELSDGIRERNRKQIIKNVFKLFVCGAIVWHYGEYIIAVGAVALIIYCFTSDKETPPPPPPPQPPTEYDYLCAMEILRGSLKNIAPQLNLSAVENDSDLSVDEEEWILPWGNCWCMKYHVLKKSAETVVDIPLIEKALQNKIKIIVTRENPTGYVNTTWIYKGKAESIIQVVKVEAPNRSIYINIYLTYASDEYFMQRSQWKKQSELPTEEADTHDNDF